MATVFPSSLLCSVNRPLDEKTNVSNIAERNAIPGAQRYKGMVVVVRNVSAVRPQIFWLPTEDLTNTGWEEIELDGSSEKNVSVPDWESGINYGEYQFTVYNGILYRCLYSHTASADFTDDETNWHKLSGAGDAADIAYHHPTLKTVEAALDKLLYEPLEITFSGGSLNEIGDEITSVNLAWTYNKDIVSQNIDNGIGSLAVSLNSYNHIGQSIMADRIYRLIANDGVEAVSAVIEVKFMPKIFWGTSPNAVLTNANILGLNQELALDKKQSRIFDCTSGQYFYVIYPAQYGEAGFLINGFKYTGYDFSQINLTNVYGHTELYNVYRSATIQTGSAIRVDVN